MGVASPKNCSSSARGTEFLANIYAQRLDVERKIQHYREIAQEAIR